MTEEECFGNYGYDEGICRFCWQYDRCSKYTQQMAEAGYMEEIPEERNL